MTALLPHLRARDGVFQYERRVPVRVQRDRILFAASFDGRVLFRRSLRTKRRDEAARAYDAVDREFEARLSPTSSNSLVPTRAPRAVPAAKRIVTDQDLDAIADRYARITADPFERVHRRANVCSAAAAELDRMQYDLELNAEAIRAAIGGRDDDPHAPTLQPSPEAALLIEEHDFLAPEGSETRAAIIEAVRDGLGRGYKRVTALLAGEVRPGLGSALTPFKPAATLTLADAIERYVEARKPPVKAASETRLALRQFEQVVGRKALAAVSRDDVHRFVEHLSNQQVGGKTVGSVVRYLSEPSIRKRLTMISAAVAHVRDRGLFEGENLFKGVKTSGYVKVTDKAVMPDKRRLQVSELNAIFAHPWFTGCASATDLYTPGDYRITGAEYWVPVVALFTGCRAAELGGLKLSEVRLDDLFPHLIIRSNEYRRTKSKRMRCIPILDALLKLGFSDYVKTVRSGGHDRLFPDWTARRRKGAGENDYPAWSNSAVIRAFNRSVIPAVLGDRLAADARREVTFHSLRGAFKAMLAANNNVPAIIVNEVVGHANTDLDDRYIGEVTIEESYPVVHRCGYANLCIPSARLIPSPG